MYQMRPECDEEERNVWCISVNFDFIILCYDSCFEFLEHLFMFLCFISFWCFLKPHTVQMYFYTVFHL